MSELIFKSVDRTALPASLMPLLKTHCRVEFNRDDEYLKQVVARAIDQFERQMGPLIFPRVYHWITTMGEGAMVGTSWLWPAPVSPFTGFTAKVDGVDVGTEYDIASSTGDPFSPSALRRVAGQPDVVPQLTASTGFADADALPLGVLDFVLKLGAWLYENRESGMAPGIDMLAYSNAMMSGQWIPRA